MKLNLTEEWCMAAPTREGDSEVGAGGLTSDLDLLVAGLAHWRNEDHADNITLNRHQIITLLDGLAKHLPAPPQEARSTEFIASLIRDNIQLHGAQKGQTIRISGYDNAAVAIFQWLAQPQGVPDNKQIAEGYSDWAWEKKGDPVGLMLPNEAARAGFFAGVAWLCRS